MDSPKAEDTLEGRSARVESTQQEIEQLTALRQAVANGLLEVSAAAKRDADRLLSGGANGEQGAGLGSATASQQRSWLIGAFGVGLASGLVIASLLWPSESVTEIAEMAEVARGVPGDEDVPRPSETPIQSEPAVDPMPPPGRPLTGRSPVSAASTDSGAALPSAGTDTLSDLTLVLTTRDDCWLSTSVDGGEPRERLLPAGRTVRLQVQQEAILKIGNAAAVSLVINGQPARPLGNEGQVVTLRVTPLNFASFLS